MKKRLEAVVFAWGIGLVGVALAGAAPRDVDPYRRQPVDVVH